MLIKKNIASSPELFLEIGTVTKNEKSFKMRKKNPWTNFDILLRLSTKTQVLFW